MKSVCVFAASVQRCRCGTHFHRGLLPPPFARVFSGDTPRVCQGVRCGAVALHLPMSGEPRGFCPPFDCEPTGMASGAWDAGEALNQKERRRCSTTGLDEPFGLMRWASRETTRNNYKHGSVWRIPFIINLPSVVTGGCSIYLVARLIDHSSPVSDLCEQTHHMPCLIKGKKHHSIHQGSLLCSESFKSY